MKLDDNQKWINQVQEMQKEIDRLEQLVLDLKEALKRQVRISKHGVVKHKK